MASHTSLLSLFEPQQTRQMRLGELPRDIVDIVKRLVYPPSAIVVLGGRAESSTHLKNDPCSGECWSPGEECWRLFALPRAKVHGSAAVGVYEHVFSIFLAGGSNTGGNDDDHCDVLTLGSLQSSSRAPTPLPVSCIGSCDWTPAPSLTRPRDRQAGGAVQNIFIVAGGFGGDQTDTETMRLDHHFTLDSIDLRMRASAPSQAHDEDSDGRRDHYTTTNSIINNNNNNNNSSSNPPTDPVKWKRSAAKMQKGRTNFCGVSVNNSVFVVSGGSDHSLEMEQYDPCVDVWNLLNTRAEIKRSFHSTVAFGHRVYLVGGESPAEGDVVECFDLRESAATCSRAPSLPARRMNAVAVAHPARLDDCFVVIGGQESWSGSSVDTSFVFDARADRWITSTSMVPPPLNYSRVRLSAVSAVFS